MQEALKIGSGWGKEDIMTIIPCYDLVIVPGVNYFFQQEILQKIVKRELDKDEEVVLLMLKEDKAYDSILP